MPNGIHKVTDIFGVADHYQVGTFRGSQPVNIFQPIIWSLGLLTIDKTQLPRIVELFDGATIETLRELVVRGLSLVIPATHEDQVKFTDTDEDGHFTCYVNVMYGPVALTASFENVGGRVSVVFSCAGALLFHAMYLVDEGTTFMMRRLDNVTEMACPMYVPDSVNWVRLPPAEQLEIEDEGEELDA